MWSEALEGLDHASRASELAPICGDCCLADCHSLRRLHPMTGFFRAPPYGDRTTNLPKTAGGSASRNGEARREAPARQSEANAAPGRITGGGGRGGSTKPYHAAHPTPPPPQPTRGSASRERAKPGAKRRRKAERSDRRAREDYGWGWAGRCQQAVPGHPPKTRPPPSTRGSASPKGGRCNRTDVPPTAPIPPPAAPSPAPRSPRRPPCQTLHAHTEPFRPFR